MHTDLYWISDAPAGRLAIMPRPRAGEWLNEELASWKSAGVDVVVSLLAEDEISRLGLEDEAMTSEEIGLTFVSFPIVDRSVPSSVDSLLSLIDRLHKNLCNDRSIAIHCRVGIGRSSLVAACLLVRSGIATQDAFAAISRARGLEVPDTNAQVEWVQSIEGQLRRR